MSMRQLLAAVFATAALSMQGALRSNHFAERSCLDDGRHVKIAVDSCGIYQISHSKLRELGFERPEQVSVRGFSASRLSSNNFTEDLPDDLPPIDFMHTADGRLLFYGEGAVSVNADDNGTVTATRNYHDTRGYYFLSSKAAEDVMDFDCNSRYAVEYVEQEKVNPGKGGAIYHDQQLVDLQTYCFNIRNLAEESNTVTLHYEFAAKSGKAFAPTVILPEGWITSEHSVKQTEPTTAANQLYTCGQGDITISGVTTDGSYNVTFSLPEGVKTGYAAMDRAWIVYRQDAKFNQSEHFSEPEVIGLCEAQNLHGDSTPEMVIVTTRRLYEAAEELAEIHRQYDGMDVRTVAQEDIFNEFSSGCRSAMAVRLYLKMLTAREPGRLRNVVMYGHSDWDRQRAVDGGALVCYETENQDEAADENRNYVSDKYFAMLEDNFDSSRTVFGKMSVNIGRIDVGTVEEGRQINDKIRKHIERRVSTNVYSNIVAASGAADNGQHVTDVENKIALMKAYNPRLTFSRVHSTAYKSAKRTEDTPCRKAMAEALTSGCGLMIYCGHTEPRALGSNGLYDASFVKQTHYDALPFALISSCETFGFDRNQTQMAQTMLKADRGGAIGIIGASRPVYLELNRSMADAIVERYALARSGTTIGDIIREAHNYCIMAYRDESRATNAMSYNLCGDPALTVGAPNARITVGATCSEGIVTVTGKVSGEEMPDGIARIRVFGAPGTYVTRDGIEYADDGAVIGETACTVAAGVIETSFVLPGDTTNGKRCRVFICAISEDGTVRASGFGEFITDTASEEGGAVEFPVIESFSVEDVATTGRETCGRSARVSAVIKSKSGLSRGGIGRGVSVTIDGRENISPTVNVTGEGMYGVECDIERVAAGSHKFTLTAQSLNGERVSKTVELVMSESRIACSLSVDERIVSDYAVIELSHNFHESPAARLIVEDAIGRNVLTVDDCRFPFVWHLEDKSGSRVEDGRYYVYALLSDMFDKAATPKLEIVAVE